MFTSKYHPSNGNAPGEPMQWSVRHVESRGKFCVRFKVRVNSINDGQTSRYWKRPAHNCQHLYNSMIGLHSLNITLFFRVSWTGICNSAFGFNSELNQNVRNRFIRCSAHLLILFQHQLERIILLAFSKNPSEKYPDQVGWGPSVG